MSPLKKIIFLIAILLILNCSWQYVRSTQILKIKGSDTMLILAQRWAEVFMQENPHHSIYVDGGGTKAGIQALIDGSAQICTASRPLRPDESRLLADKYHSLGLAFLVAKDAVSIYLHPDNPVRNLTSDDLHGIFTGRITNWSRLGGDDQPIHVLMRSPNSGTRLYLKEHVLADESFLTDSQIEPTTAEMTRSILNDPWAIGYGGLAYGPELFHCPIDSIAPTAENVINGSYPLSRYLYLYTIDIPRGNVQRFIDWVQSPAGQSVVAQIGYIPLWPESLIDSTD